MESEATIITTDKNTNKMRKTTLAVAMSALALLAACSSEDENDDFIVCPVERPISVAVGTRAAQITTSTLQHFYMYGKEQTYEITRQQYAWNITPNSWPNGAEDDEEVTFYAFNTDAASGYHPNGNYISLSVAEDAFNQKDLLIATNTTSFAATNGTGNVDLTFDHVCSALAVSMQMSNTLKTALGANDLKVLKVVLKNVKKSGRYDLTTHQWTANEETTDYTLSNSTEGVTMTTEKYFLPCGYLFLIPQNLSESTIDVEYQIGAKTPKVKTYTLNKELRGNVKDTLNILFE